jgi:glycosyltransferase involved in cell wall biosynthesis
MEPLVSIIIPCFNEEKSIGELLDNILLQDYPADRLEVFIIDGMSTDRTHDIIMGYSGRHQFIRLLKNEKRFVPFALNMGILESKGDVIVRMDVHSLYPQDYISRLVKSLYELNADNVGGVLQTLPSGSSPKARAIALALSSPFGVGDSRFRVGVKEARKVDTVPFGCFRRELFNRIGMFDQELLRNQDDEFNARIIENGGSVYLLPDIVITYYARPDIASLSRMFFQYGYFKPLVNRKLKRPSSLRQFIPPLFVLFLLAGWTFSFISTGFLYLYAAVAGLYILANLVFTIKSAWSGGKASTVFFLPWIFFIQHMAYGFGYLGGLINFVFMKKSQESIRNSR